jgi:hypothetical protein
VGTRDQAMIAGYPVSTAVSDLGHGVRLAWAAYPEYRCEGVEILVLRHEVSVLRQSLDGKRVEGLSQRTFRSDRLPPTLRTIPDSQAPLWEREIHTAEAITTVEPESGSDGLHQACNRRMNSIEPCCAQFTPNRLPILSKHYFSKEALSPRCRCHRQFLLPLPRYALTAADHSEAYSTFSKLTYMSNASCATNGRNWE